MASHQDKDAPAQDYHALNAKLNLFGLDGKIQFDADKQAAKAYFLEHVNQNTVFFHSLSEKLEYLVEKGYYEKEVLDLYPNEFIATIWDAAFRKKFRFPTFMGAFKYYTSYTLKTRDGKRFLERYEDRVVMTALALARGDQDLAMKIMNDIIDGRFQPATPTFLNAGKAARGELVSCFPAGTLVDTIDGQKPIEKIEKGTLVLTESGKYHPVIALNTRKNKEALLNIKIVGVPAIDVTPEHPFLVQVEKEDDREEAHPYKNEKFKWIKARDLRPLKDQVVMAAPLEIRESQIVEDKKLALVQAITIANDVKSDFVYNIQVENDPTYSVNGVIVHNCFLVRIEDNMESISRAHNSALQLSKRGGGVAILLSNLRERGASIKGIENACSGIIPVMKMFEDAFSYANQLGARDGAGAVYLNVHHPDIMNFLDTKRENADEKTRIKTLSLGVVIPDITFEIAKNNEDMYLFSPLDVEKVYGVPFSDISVTEKYHEMVENPAIRKKKINARKLFETIAELQFESGYPYVMFEDTVNRANPIEGRINMSNLCVHGDTRILTDKGHVRIADVVGTKQNVWNGEEWSSVDVVQTNSDQSLVRVTLSDGSYLDCTKEHKFYVQNRYVHKGRTIKPQEIRAGQLAEGMKLIKLTTPVIEGTDTLDKAYTNGFYTGDGCRVTSVRGEDFDRIYLYGEKKSLRNNIEHPFEDWTGDERLMSGRVSGLREKFFVPTANFTVKSRLDWFAGLLDSDGTVCKNGTSKTVQIASVNLSFLDEVKLMLQTLGVQSKISLAREAGDYELPANDGTGEKKTYPCKTIYRLLIGGQGAADLVKLGLETHRLDLTRLSPNRNALRFVTVVSVNEIEGLHDTFCFTEPKRHMGVFNGILTGQCSEILQVNSPSTYHDNLDYKHVGTDISCNLGSLNIAKVMDGGDLGSTVNTAIRALTAVSEMSNIDSVPSIKKGNDESHAIGLGQMNLHGFLGRELIHYDSPEAVEFTSVYFAAVLYHALMTSNELAIERGKTFKGFKKSTYASGEFFDKYTEKDWLPKSKTVKGLFKKFKMTLPTIEDWQALKESVMKHGIYNRNLQAVPPTGSISYINNSTSSIHPITSLIEIRKEGKIGRVYYPAPYLTNENIEYFKDAYQIGPSAIINVYAAATEHVDQGLSLTMFFTDKATTRDINKAQIEAWLKGIKTIYYIRIRQEALEGTEIEGCVSCSL